jgi:hypothetical protein
MTVRIAQSNFLSIARLMALVGLTTAALSGQDSSKAKPLPTVQQVMDHYVSALGGRDAIFKHKSMTVRGKYELSDKGLSLDRTAYYKGGKMLYQVALPNGSHYQEGFDGTVAWQINASGSPTISGGDEGRSKERDADMYYPARIMDYFSSMGVVDVTEFERHTCYHLKGTNKWGKVNEHFYDTTTGLLVGYRFNSSWRGGSGDESEVFSDYKDFGGWLMPTRAVHKSADGTQAETTTAVTFDDVDDSVFVLPDAVKALLAKKGQG